MPELDPALLVVTRAALLDADAQGCDVDGTAALVVQAVLAEQRAQRLRSVVAEFAAIPDDVLTEVLDTNPHMHDRLRAVIDRELAKARHPSMPVTVLRPVPDEEPL